MANIFEILNSSDCTSHDPAYKVLILQRTNIKLFERLLYLDVVEKEMSIGQVKYHFFHSVRHLGEKGGILTVFRCKLSSEQRVKHNYGFIKVPDEYPVGTGFCRIRRAYTVSTSALTSSSSARFRRRSWNTFTYEIVCSIMSHIHPDVFYRIFYMRIIFI